MNSGRSLSPRATRTVGTFAQLECCSRGDCQSSTGNCIPPVAELARAVAICGSPARISSPPTCQLYWQPADAGLGQGRHDHVASSYEGCALWHVDASG